MNINRIPVAFYGKRKVVAPAIMYKYNQKQVLEILGFYGLPEYFRVDFANEGDALAKSVIGTPDGIEIPDEYLLTGKAIKAYIVLNGPDESVQTVGEIDIPVNGKLPVSEETPTPEKRSIVDELIAALNDGVERAEAAAETAEQHEADAGADALKAEGYATGTQDGQAVEEGSDYYHNNAAYYSGQASAQAEAAAGSATTAAGHATAAGEAKTDAETAKRNAEAAQEGAETAKRKAEEAEQAILDLTAGATVDANTGTPSVEVNVTETGGHKNLAFIFRNLKGAKGDTGNGISRIELKSTSGLNKVYRITMTSGSTFDFTVTDGNGISRIDKTGTSGLTDTYTITYDDESTSTFTVKNGNGIRSMVLNADYTLTVTYDDGTTWTSGSIRGAVGQTPEFSVGTVESVPWDEEAEASITGTAENPVLNLKIPKGEPATVRTNQYAARWDLKTHKMERVGLAVGITDDVTNFAHRGSINANYDNPFDSIYPWSGMKLCNIDIEAYMALQTGDSLTDCVTAWDGDPDFDWDDPNGIWRYTPEFYGRSYMSEGYRYFDVSATDCDKGYIFYPESIKGRWQGRTVSMTVGGEEKDVFLPLTGMPDKLISQVTLHDRANAYNGTLDNIWTVDRDNLLMIVEYADMNMQEALGAGCDAMYRQSSDKFVAAATDSTVVKVNKNNAQAFCLPGAIFDIGTSNGGTQKGSFQIISVEQDPDNSAWLDVTLDEAVTVTTGNFWSVHGICNAADQDIGSQSGWIGTEGKSNCYYRGTVDYGNLWFYVLGAYQQTGTHKVWLAHDPDEADAYDAVNTSVHIDTGIYLPEQNGVYIKSLAMVDGFSALPICDGTGGNSTNPVGDGHYFANGNHVLRVGGGANNGAIGGPFGGSWYNPALYASWYFGARPVLKSP